MSDKNLLTLVVDFLNDRSLFQKFLDYCEDIGEDRAEIEDAIDEFENQSK